MCAFDLKPAAASSPAMTLSQKLFDFLEYTVEKHFDTSQHTKLLHNWACTFDTFLKKQPSDFVIAVFDFYVKEWRKKKGFVHISPESFIGDFSLIAQRYRWYYQPIPTGDLRNILQPLRKEQWDCEWDLVVISVSQSLHNIRLFLQAIKKAEIPHDLKRQARAIYGHIQEYTTRYYLEWRNRQIDAVWTATITQERIFNDVRKCFRRHGLPGKQITDYLQDIKNAYVPATHNG
jgi:hypothetical protein